VKRKIRRIKRRWVFTLKKIVPKKIKKKKKIRHKGGRKETLIG